MQKSLAIDIGNSRVKYGVFDNDSLVLTEVAAEFSKEDILRIVKQYGVGNVILSSVGERTEMMDLESESDYVFYQLSSDTPLPFEINYKTPQTLGKDRIAAIAGAYHLFPKSNCLVIDAGTCFTYDLLEASGTFLGGNISPGIEMRLKAMNHFTARLPLAERENNPDYDENWLGDSTASALRIGSELGAICEMQAFIKKCRHTFRPLKIIITGGDAIFFGKRLKTKIFAHQNLVLIGLNKILQYNVKIFRGRNE